MAGQLTIDTLKASSGVLATQNGMTGIAKAWAVFNGTAGTLTNSFNISSVTKSATGNYSLSFTTSMPNANYSVVGGAGDVTANISISTNTGVAPTTSTFYVRTYTSTGSAYIDGQYISIAVFSS